MGSDAPHAVRGQAGERAVAAFLEARGHRVLERNWRGQGGEIDLITRRDGILHFVEVKTRSSDDFGGGWDSLGAGKRRRIARTAEAFLLGAPEHDGCVFSVALVSHESGEYTVEFVEDAFDATR